MAKDVLAIPVSGVGVERLFSMARDVVTYRRNRFRGTTIERVMLIKRTSWFEGENKSLPGFMLSVPADVMERDEHELGEDEPEPTTHWVTDDELSDDYYGVSSDQESIHNAFRPDSPSEPDYEAYDNSITSLSDRPNVPSRAASSNLPNLPHHHRTRSPIGRVYPRGAIMSPPIGRVYPRGSTQSLSPGILNPNGLSTVRVEVPKSQTQTNVIRAREENLREYVLSPRPTGPLKRRREESETSPRENNVPKRFKYTYSVLIDCKLIYPAPGASPMLV